jgi:hypothetical protein
VAEGIERAPARDGARLHTSVDGWDLDASGRPHEKPSRWLVLGVALGFLALTLVLTRPGVSRFVTHLMADDTDGYQNAWTLWWIKTALLHGHWPWWTDRLFAPDGVSLYFHTLALTNGLIALPVQLMWPLTVAYNVVVVTSFVASGLALYGLARYAGADPGPAFVAGCLYTFSPFHFAHGIAHLNMLALQWLPLYVWALLAACRSARPASGVLAGLVLFGVVLTDFYFALFCALATGLIAVWLRTWRVPALALATGVALSAPLGIPMLRLVARTALSGAHDPADFSVDLLGWLVPGEVSLWGSLTAPIWRRFGAYPEESGAYLGLIPVAIVALGLRARARAIVPWVAGAAIFAILALGPWLRVAGVPTFVPLPYFVLTSVIPLITLAGVPARFMAMAYLGLAMAVALALTALLPARPALRRVTILGLVLAGLILEYAPRPYTTTPFVIPSFYTDLAREADVGQSVLELPSGTGMLYQTVHGKRIVGGYVSRTPRAQYEAFVTHPVVRFLAEGLPCTESLRTEINERLRHEAVRWIVLHGTLARRPLHACLGLPVRVEPGAVLIGPVAGG